MCISSVLHGILNISLMLAILFTLISIFTPQWRSQQITTSATVQGVQQTVSAVGTVGVAISNCLSGVSNVSGLQACLGLTNAPPYQQAAVAFLCLTIIISAIAFTLTCVACLPCTCCIKTLFMKPLPIMLGICCLFNIIAVTCYAVGTGNDFNALIAQAQTMYNNGTASGVTGVVTGQNNIGYSMWLAIFSIVLFFADTILALLLACVSKVAPVL